jgi:beta-lactamase regulating signal transducer with metallopeptidase domain
MMDVLVGLAAKSLLIAAATLGLLALARRRSAADRSWIAHLGLFAMLALPFASLALPALSVELPEGFAAAAPAPVVAPIAPTPEAHMAEAVMVDPPQTIVAPGAEPAPVDWTPYAYSIPLVALLLVTLVALLRLFALRRRAQVLVDPVWLSALAHAQRRMGFKNGTALLTSSELNSPISWGLMRPVILLNDEALAASGDAEAIIAHELAHVARFDWAKLMLARIATAVFWFNPLAWLLAREAHQLREEAADDAVLASNVVDTDYAQLLVGVARHECKGLLLGAHGISPGKNSLRRRVSRVLDSSLARGTGGRSWVAGFAVGMLVMSAPLAALTFAPAPPRAPQPPHPPEPFRPQAAALAPAAPAAPTAPVAVISPLAAEAAIAPLPPQPARPPRPPRPPATPLEAEISSAVSHAVSTALVATAQATRGLGELDHAMRARARRRDARSAALQAVGVTPQYAAAIRAAGPQFSKLDEEALIELRVKGVTPEYVRALAAAGYGHESVEQIGDAATLGVSAAALRGYARIAPRRSLEEVTELSILGVTPDFVAAAQRGGAALSKEQLIELRLGVPRRKRSRTP